MRTRTRGRPPYIPPIEFDPPRLRPLYEPTPAILVRLAIRSLVVCRASGAPFPEPILAALDRRVRSGCPTAATVRDLIERNGLVKPLSENDASSACAASACAEADRKTVR